MAGVWHQLVVHLLLLYISCVSTESVQPNIMVILVDDMGFGDLSSYGHPTQEWNILDQMATEGVRFTQFYSPATFCTPSRAAILTGRLPVRLGMLGEVPVFLPGHSTGLPSSEVTVAELLRDNGYRTGMVGKWHLGINEFNATDGRHLPDKHGYDYVGTLLPFTLEPTCDQTGTHRTQTKACRCFLYQNGAIVQQPLDLTSLTRTLVADAQDFIRGEHSEDPDKPFFLMMSFPQAHTPMFNDPIFRTNSTQAQYHDQINEIAWAVEHLMAIIRDSGAIENTMVVFLSDHGPHKEACLEGGSAGMLRGGKGNFYDGGVRVPAFFWWPGHIEPNPANLAVASHMDVLPTLADFANISLPSNILLDGETLRPILQPKLALTDSSESVTFRNRVLFFYCREYLTAVRFGSYKIHFREQMLQQDIDGQSLHCTSGIPSTDLYTDMHCEAHHQLAVPAVYNLKTDPGERYPLSESDSQSVLEAVEIHVEEHRRGMFIPSKHLFDREFLSESLVPCCNPPYCVCNNKK